MVDGQAQFSDSDASGMPAEQEKWEDRCSEIASLLDVLRYFVPARVTNPGPNSDSSELNPNSSAFPHILRTRTSKFTPDKPLNHFLQGLADICAHSDQCNVFANAMKASIPPTPKSGSGRTGGHSGSRSAVRTSGPVQPEPAGPVVESEESNGIRRVFFCSNEGIEVEPKGPRMRAYMDHCLTLLNTLHRIYVTDIRVNTDPNSVFRDFKNRTNIPVIAAFEREIALLVYTQCFKKVKGRIEKHHRAYYTVKHLHKMLQQNQHPHAPRSPSEPGSRRGETTGTESPADALRRIIPNLGLFVRLCNKESMEHMEKEITNQVNALIMELTSDPTQSTGIEAMIPARPKEWIVEPEHNLPSDDHLFLMYRSGLAISKVVRNPRIKDWLEELKVLLGNNYYIEVEQVLEKAAKMSQAVENIVYYALRHSTSSSTPGIPWTLTLDFLPPIQPVTMPCITMDGERLLELYNNHSYPLEYEDKIKVEEWGDDFHSQTEDYVRNSMVHAEVNLVARLINRREGADEIYPFIGCSKLSCYPCDMYFKAIREAGHYKFHTQGGHEKIYGRQWYPAPLDWDPKAPRNSVPILEHMIKDVLHDIWCTRSTYTAGSLSDSTGESGGGSGSEE